MRDDVATWLAAQLAYPSPSVGSDPKVPVEFLSAHQQV